MTEFLLLQVAFLLPQLLILLNVFCKQTESQEQLALILYNDRIGGDP